MEIGYLIHSINISVDNASVNVDRQENTASGGLPE